MNEVFREYRIVEQLAVKKYSSLYRAQSPSDPARQVVIKVFTSNHLHSEQDSAHFLHETTLLKQLHHPHILSIIDAGVAREHPYIINPLLAAGSLRERLKNARLSTREALSILKQIGEALAYAHEWEIIHGNLKPENILFDTEQQAVLADFMLPDTIDPYLPGYRPDVRSALYMAPEQLGGNVGSASDQYALGCLAYELLTGQVPFTGAAFSTISAKHIKETPLPLSQYALNIPAALEHVVLKALEKDPTQRYKSVARFLQAFTSSADEQIVATSAIPLSITSGFQADAHEAEMSSFTTPSTAPVEPRSTLWTTQPVTSSRTVSVAPVAAMASSLAYLSNALSLFQSRATDVLTARVTIPFVQRTTKRWIVFAVALCTFVLSVTFITQLFNISNTSALTQRNASARVGFHSSASTPVSRSTLSRVANTPTPLPTPDQPQATMPAQSQGPVSALPSGSNPTTPDLVPTPISTSTPAPTPEPESTPTLVPQLTPTDVTPTPTPTVTPKRKRKPTPTPTPISTPMPTSTPVPTPTSTPKSTSITIPTSILNEVLT